MSALPARRRAGEAAAILLMLALCWPALAQTQQGTGRTAPRSPAAPAAPAAPVEPAPTAYEPDMLRLAEVIGSLAFLRQLCGGAEAPAWRQRMTELLDAEGTTPGRRERLAGAYNRGFRGFALTYRTCTAAAGEATARLSADGERLSRILAGRFGG
ncbi:MAG: TIGR02301 family protein [Beijerinckiaceae bacterium]|nr:TIGR02301 family protein [Beijerinckiaceae bacterium]